MYKSKNKPDRIILFEIGVIAALLFVNFLLSLGYTSSFVIEEPPTREFDTIYSFTTEVKTQQVEETIKEKVVQQKAMVFDPTAFIKQVDHLLEEPLKDILPSFDHLPQTIPQNVVPSVAEPTNNIVTFATKRPQYPGGEKALEEYIQENFYVSPIMMDHAEIIKIDIEYVINKDGHVSDIKILRCSHPGLGAEQEAMRMLRKMPNWEPAEHNGYPVNIRVIQPIKIQIF